MTRARSDIERDFRMPPASARALLRWWWPGGAVEADALCEQLREFASSGWGGVEIQAFRVGLPHVLPPAAAERVHEVFTPRWFECVRAVMDEAARLGMTVDITFGSCWPFGGGETITPELAAQELSLAWTTVQGPGVWQGRPNAPARPQRFGTRMERDGTVDAAQALPDDWRARIDAMEQTVAVLAVRGGTPSLGPYAGFVPLTLPDPWGQVHAAGWIDAAARVDLTERRQPDGTLQWDVPPGTWQIAVVRRFVSDQRITEAAGHGPQLVLDHLKREAFDAHAARVGDAALPYWREHAGRTWRSVFADSLEVPTDLHWTDDFASEFERRRGYALQPFLPLLLQPGWRNCFQARVCAPLFDDPQVGERVRADYRLTVSELMIERHYTPLVQWGQRHGVQAKIQAHGAPVDWLQAYGVAHIPETEDLAGYAAPHFLRVARSAAHLYGRKLVSAEAFCWLLEGLAVTPQQIRERADEFFVNGVQQMIGNGASAPLMGQGDDALPWYPFEAMEIGTQIDDANPLWPLMRPLVDYLARCQTVLQRGAAVVPVAVLAPLDLFAFTGAAERLVAPAWHEALQDAGLDWDWINADALLKSRIDGASLITPGGHRYRALLLPELPALRAEVAERLAACAAAGIAVWAVGTAPQREEGYLDAAARDARVRAAMDNVLDGGRRVAAPSAIGRALRVAGVPPCIALPAGHGLQFHVREDDGARWLFLRNPRSEAATAALPVEAGQGAELWHGWSGWRQRLAPDAAACVRIALAPRGARIVRMAAVEQCVAHEPATQHAGRLERVLDGGWSVSAQGRGLHGRPIAFEEHWPGLRDLSQRDATADFAGCIVYTCTVDLTDTDLAQGPLWLDLGRVHDAASVQVNHSAPVIGCEGPFVFDIARGLRPGANIVRITVANRAENARRDPAHPGGIPIPGRRLSRLPTGLLGPVRLITPFAPATRWCLARRLAR
jgi:hypothetical protein